MDKAIKLNLLIGTPAYNSMVHTDYMHSILSYHESKLPFSVMTIGNESLITRGRNTILSYFYHMEQFTHLLFLDADIYLHAQELIKLISYQKDVIGAPVALKGKNKFTGEPVYNFGEVLSKDGSMITTNKIGTAVFMLSRNAVESLVSDSKEKGMVYYPNPHTRGDTAPHDMEMYDVFRVGVKDGEYLSEDYFACNTLRELGYDVYVDLSVKTKHNGMYIFE